MKILYVEDSDLEAEIVEALTGRSVDVFTRAADGLDAISKLENDFDLVLLDLNLPKVHGFEVIRQARATARHAQTPIVVFSSSSSEVDVKEAMRLGASAYVVKPNNAGGMRDFLAALRSFWSFHAG